MTGGEAMEKKLMLAPSMGCCDLYDFGHQVKFIDEHADFLHIDIKDGNYVKITLIASFFAISSNPFSHSESPSL